MKRRIVLVYALGSLSGLMMSMLSWLLGYGELFGGFGLRWVPGVYQNMVWGGVFGMVFLLPADPRRWWWNGFIFGGLPAVAQLFWALPQTTDYGFAGLKLGWLTSLAVIAYYTVWGWITGLLLRTFD